jgi:ABC-type Zn uptake system ZnuABC Zn-binding protein ZnuA
LRERVLRLLPLLSVCALVLAGCNSGSISSSGGSSEAKATRAEQNLGWSDTFAGNGKLNVATTVAPISDIARNIGGDRINLHGLIPDGTDSHTFEPAPSDAQILGKADLIIVNGLHLETPTEKLASANLKKDTQIYRLGESTLTEANWLFDFSFPRDQGDPNPHVWMNPQYASRYAELICRWLGARDPENNDYYVTNYKRYKAVLDQLDAAIETSVNTIPADKRKLLTYHDSWAYFARRYNLTVIGAVQPSDFKEPSPREVARLIDQIKQEKVPAVFGSEVFPSKILEQIARESGAKYIDKLRDDEPPGEAGDRLHTYVGMMLDDMQSLIPALGGNVDALKSIDTANTWAK